MNNNSQAHAPSKHNKEGPLSKKGKEYLPAGYSGITMVEEKLRASEAQVAALTEEIKSLRKVQELQGKALSSLSSEHDYPTKINNLLEDLRVQKEQNRVLRTSVYDAEKSSKLAHENMINYEQTIRELKKTAQESKTSNTKTKVNEKLQEAADKIDELV